MVLFLLDLLINTPMRVETGFGSSCWISLVMIASKSSASDVFHEFDRYSGENDAPTYKFTPKFLKSVKNNPLSGICFLAWVEILTSRWRQIDYHTYWPRLVVISLLSVFNSLLGFIEYLLYESSIRKATPHPRPVFILGHPRTGTTLLHSLVAMDEDQFDVCTTFCAGFPSCFLWFERIGKVLFQGVLDDTRPMDNVVLDFDLPQEDELATNVLTAGTSPYMPLFFMSQETDFRPYYAFDDNATGDEALPEAQMPKARKRWVESFYYLCQKLTLRSIKRHGEKRRLLLKSPVHTARIPLLLRIFPNAQFIYIHRNPYEVFRSAAHMADTTYWYTYCNTPRDDQILEFILRQYEILWDRYEDGKQILLQSENNDTKQEKRLVEVSYSALSRRPVETVSDIYNQLGWEMSGRMEDRLSEIVEKEVMNYKRNSHMDIDSAMKSTIGKRWARSFDELGYKK
eukprot:scaffold2563_cov124-Cylindrotheca_fusiformis.AAC.3